MKRGFAFFITIFLFFSCAQQSQPLSGGPKDKTPPEVVYSIPDNGAKNYKKKEIIIKFDEYFSLKNIQNEFFYSPPMSSPPKLKVTKKKLHIILKDDLRDSATYWFYFGNSIVDYHEGNILKDFSFVFSTYSQLDSFKVSGKVIDAYTLEPLEGITVALYSKNEDSIPMKSLPDYIAKTDTAGNFEITHIRQGKYKIFAFEDINSNFIFDKDEGKLAFCDTLISPWIKVTSRFDTLDSGFVFKRTDYNDTLKSDTIIETKISHYFPNNLELKIFSEESSEQNIKYAYRKSRGQIVIAFVKPLLKNYFEILQNKEDFKVEFFSNSDSVYVWTKNSDILNNDTISFLCEYYEFQNKKKIDTILVSGYDYELDSLPIKIIKSDEKVTKNIPFSFYSPIYPIEIDTSLIKLYEIVDTVVIDLKEQDFKYFRPEYDSLVFVFKRPLQKLFRLEVLGENNKTNSFIFSKNKTNNIVFCKITDSSLLKNDTLHLKVYYDNLFFYNEIQQLSKVVNIPVVKQKLVEIKRPVQDSIYFVFSKNLPQKIDLFLLTDSAFSKGYKYEIAKNVIAVKLNDKALITNDTLLWKLHFYKMKDINGNEEFFDDTIKSIYIFDKNEILYKRRYYRSKIIFVFKKPLIAPPQLKLLSFKPLKKWYSLDMTPTKDTVFVDIFNQRVLRLIDMRMSVNYLDVDHHNDTLFLVDTFLLKVEKGLTQSTDIKIVSKEQKVRLYKPIKFYIQNNENDLRKFQVISDYIEGNEYKVSFDSAAVKGLWSLPSDTTTFYFKVLTPEDFVNLSIDIKNIWAITGETGGKNNYSLPKGQLVLIIENEYVQRKITLKTDKILKDPAFVPGKYRMKIFYDENMNGRWDTGSYPEHRQPEKVIVYPHELNLSAGKDEKVIWDLANP